MYVRRHEQAQFSEHRQQSAEGSYGGCTYWIIDTCIQCSVNSKRSVNLFTPF